MRGSECVGVVGVSVCVRTYVRMRGCCVWMCSVYVGVSVCIGM